MAILTLGMAKPEYMSVTDMYDQTSFGHLVIYIVTFVTNITSHTKQQIDKKFRKSGKR